MARNPGNPRPITVSGEEARQGRIVLRTKTRRAIFLGGLIGIGILLAIVTVVWRVTG